MRVLLKMTDIRAEFKFPVKVRIKILVYFAVNEAWRRDEQPTLLDQIWIELDDVSLKFWILKLAELYH